jgi:hypothetical protein
VADPSETTQASRAPATEEASELLGAVRELSAQVGGLQAELNAMRSHTRALPSGDMDVPGWEIGETASRDGSVWMRSIASPAARRPAVPRLLLEILFLVAVACLAAVARLDTALVIVVMAGAWLLVALAEWTADRAVRLRNEAAFGRYSGPGEDPAWFAPPRQQTVLEVVEGGEDTAARLPPPTSA